MDVLKYNSEAWDKEVQNQNKWTVPLTHEEYLAAKRGEIPLLLTPFKPVPKSWLAKVKGRKVLCLAAGGGQQGPIMAALGGDVSVFDASAAQLARDKEVVKRENIGIDLTQGDMRDLSEYDDGQFDIIVHPVSNCFVENIEDVWKECYRVLRQGGTLMAGFANPLNYLFDRTQREQDGKLVVRHRLPYSDLEQLSKEELAAMMQKGEPLEFGHSLEAQIGGQLKAGFVLSDLYEDNGGDVLDDYTPSFLATRAFKL